MTFGDSRLPRRFWAKVASANEAGCWVWLAATSAGYGRFLVEGRLEQAHRVSYERLIGRIPEGLQIDHLCRVRGCVNPAHMEPVTARVNTLRGEGATAIHAAQTHCGKGHPLSGENVRVRRRAGKVSGRVCVACYREWCHVADVKRGKASPR